jgi:tetratricopeptide (TPR) repeat protein
LKRIYHILEGNPNDRHALYFLGELYRESDTEKSSFYFNKLVHLYPNSYLAGLSYNSLAYKAASDKNNDLAFNYIQKAANLCADNSSVLNNLSYQYSIRGDYEISINKLKSIIKNEPYRIIALWNVINSLRSLGEFQESYNYNHKLIECIEDEESLNVGANLVSFFFQTDSNGNGVFFENIHEKKCYSYYSAALTCNLLNKNEEANRFLEKAQVFDDIDKISPIKFLYYNIECIQKNNLKPIDKLENIKEHILEGSIKFNPNYFKLE